MLTQSSILGVQEEGNWYWFAKKEIVIKIDEIWCYSWDIVQISFYCIAVERGKSTFQSAFRIDGRRGIDWRIIIERECQLRIPLILRHF